MVLQSSKGSDLTAGVNAVLTINGCARQIESRQIECCKVQVVTKQEEDGTQTVTEVIVEGPRAKLGQGIYIVFICNYKFMYFKYTKCHTP